MPRASRLALLALTFILSPSADVLTGTIRGTALAEPAEPANCLEWNNYYNGRPPYMSDAQAQAFWDRYGLYWDPRPPREPGLTARPACDVPWRASSANCSAIQCVRTRPCIQCSFGTSILVANRGCVKFRCIAKNNTFPRRTP